MMVPKTTKISQRNSKFKFKNSAEMRLLTAIEIELDTGIDIETWIIRNLRPCYKSRLAPSRPCFKAQIIANEPIST